jgi:hypothetical protein
MRHVIIMFRAGMTKLFEKWANAKIVVIQKFYPSTSTLIGSKNPFL